MEVEITEKHEYTFTHEEVIHALAQTFNLPTELFVLTEEDEPAYSVSLCNAPHNDELRLVAKYESGYEV